MPAEAGARLEGLEAERFRRGRLDHLPDVDPHPVAELGELVHERDVDRAVDVLEQLRQLGRLGRGDLVDGVDRVRSSAAAAAVHSGVMPPTTFGVVFVVQSVRPGSHPVIDGDGHWVEYTPVFAEKMRGRRRQSG